jgi:hypothetical protein
VAATFGVGVGRGVGEGRGVLVGTGVSVAVGSGVLVLVAASVGAACKVEQARDTETTINRKSEKDNRALRTISPPGLRESYSIFLNRVRKKVTCLSDFFCLKVTLLSRISMG